VRDQLTAGMLLLDRQSLIRELDQPWSPDQVRGRLADLLREQWATSWIKSPPKKHPSRPVTKTPVRGGHYSAWKLIQAAKSRTAPSRPP
jgi:hypothetical protein